MKKLAFVLLLTLTSCISTYVRYSDEKYVIHAKITERGRTQNTVWYVHEYKMSKDTIVIKAQGREWRVPPPYSIQSLDPIEIGSDN